MVEFLELTRMSGGMATDRMKDDCSRQMEALGFAKLQATMKSILKESSRFHGHFTLTFVVYDGAVTCHKVAHEETTKIK